jgi:hypothetical protein
MLSSGTPFEAGPVQGPPRGYRAQRRYRFHAEGRPELVDDTGRHRLQPRHDRQDCEAGRLIAADHHHHTAMRAALLGGLFVAGLAAGIRNVDLICWADTLLHAGALARHPSVA